MERISVKAYAKINLSLAVTGLRQDGYHTLDMLLQSVSLCDIISISRGEGFTLTSGGRLQGERNLCTKAAQAFFGYTGITPSCRAELVKRIPVCAGMGGGSADAAATLAALNMFYRTAIPHNEMARLALSLGADVPFMLTGGLQRARGIGEQLEACRLGRKLFFLCLFPSRGASTREIFAMLGTGPQPPIDNDSLQAALERGDIRDAARYMGNQLQSVTASVNAEVDACISALLDAGALCAMMTGSGSACFGVFQSAAAAEKAKGQMEHRSMLLTSRSSSMEFFNIR